MYGVFFMMFVLILSFVTRNIINYPLMWIIEMAQFTITAYYLLGGGYSMITDDHVRMDLFYGRLSERGKAKMDAFTSIFLIFYLIILFYGSITSLQYTIQTKQKLLQRGHLMFGHKKFNVNWYFINVTAFFQCFLKI